MRLTGKHKTLKTVMSLTIIFLIIELLDELVGGVLDPAWPLIRQDLNLSYGQVGLLLALPSTISQIIEPIFGIWADMGHRRRLIIGGGMGFAIALFLLSFSQDFTGFTLGLMLLGPASGSFVNIAQATLMDLEPTRHEQNMARWTLAGSLGNVMGPLILAVAIALNQGWRGALFILAVLSGLMAVLLWRSPNLFRLTSSPEARKVHSLNHGFRNAISALKRPNIVRWLTLLQFSDLMLDVFRGFVALYFVDVVNTNATQASFAMAIWLGFGLLGDFLLIPLLERVRGLTYLKVSVILVLCLYPAFLLVPSLTTKYIVLGCLGFLNAGWYSILQGQLYTAMLGQSGSVITLSNLFGLIGSLAPLLIGVAALYIGLGNAMWILITAPIALLIGLLR
ncbi:MFS transporter [Leptolyngbyaceae cyanobacterium CCMR0082]|uniref:MFS transporter n=1 Tax=Adonisia turfae CCMR0082 TaxID=2304604 RepID=A0A6M0SG65_9CYAN|nr:MFS transporter [Adonisia turfae]NEZ67549.1 MFS transporter [Adonisia turfae CCMR0082]